MKNLLLACILSSSILIGCENKGCGCGNAAISSSGAKAHMLSLSSEDIRFLNQQSPTVLEKIDKRENIDLDDIIVMHESGVSTESIISIVDYTQTKIELNTNDVIRLQMEGISYKVINHLIKS